MIKNRLFTVILMIITLGCDNQNNVDNSVRDGASIQFSIKDSDTSLDMSVCYSVYVSDTNWIRMAKYADSLVSDKGYWSSVAFFNDSLNTPNLEFCAFNLDYKPVGGYTLDEADGKFKLYYGKRTLLLPKGKTVPMHEINGTNSH